MIGLDFAQSNDNFGVAMVAFDEDRASKHFNIVPVKPKQTRNNSNDQQSETDSRSLDDFNNFLKKVETAEGEK